MIGFGDNIEGLDECLQRTSDFFVVLHYSQRNNRSEFKKPEFSTEKELDE